MKTKFLLGVFTDEHKMVHAAEDLKKRKIPIYDFFTPFPVHGLDELLEIKRTKLPYVTFVAGLIGLIFALSFQYWISVKVWPINIGGKADNAFAAYIPIAFEITVLFGAFISIFAFLFKSKLFPKIDRGVVLEGATQDKFVIALELNDASVDIKALEHDFKHHGAESVETREVCL